MSSFPDRIPFLPQSAAESLLSARLIETLIGTQLRVALCVSSQSLHTAISTLAQPIPRPPGAPHFDAEGWIAVHLDLVAAAAQARSVTATRLPTELALAVRLLITEGAVLIAEWRLNTPLSVPLSAMPDRGLVGSPECGDCLRLQVSSLHAPQPADRRSDAIAHPAPPVVAGRRYRVAVHRVRHLTITSKIVQHRCRDSAKSERSIPQLRISAKWLRQVGFNTGQTVRVQVDSGRLVLLAHPVPAGVVAEAGPASWRPHPAQCNLPSPGPRWERRTTVTETYVASRSRFLGASGWWVPMLRIAAAWLRPAGFDIGKRVRVQVAPGRLVITALAGRERCRSRSDR
jgi:antitoxin component of MazEF toxin-antitoxin module